MSWYDEMTTTIRRLDAGETVTMIVNEAWAAASRDLTVDEFRAARAASIQRDGKVRTLTVAAKALSGAANRLRQATPERREGMLVWCVRVPALEALRSGWDWLSVYETLYWAAQSAGIPSEDARAILLREWPTL